MGLAEFIAISLCLNATCPPENATEVDIASLSRRNTEALARRLKGKHLRITTVQNPPLSYTEIENDTVVGKGVAFDCLNFLKAKYGFTYSVVLPDQDGLGDVQSGLFGMLASDKADISAAFVPVLPKFWNYIVYSTNLDVGDFVVLMQRPSESAQGSGLLSPFTTPVWLLIIVSLLVAGPLMHYIIYLRARLCKDGSEVYSLKSCMWFVYGALLKQGTTLDPTTDTSRLLFSTWWIFITILTAYYTANLTAFLTLSRFTLPINEPKDIAAKGYHWITRTGSTVQTFNNEQTRAVQNKILPQRLARYVPYDDDAILENHIKNGKAMYVRDKTIVKHLMYKDYLKKARRGIQEENRCTYVMSTFTVIQVARAFAYSRNFAFRNLFDESLQHLVQAGVLQYMTEYGLPGTKICPLNLGSKERRLKNADLFMTYVIVVGGFGISMLVFFVELLWRSQHVKKRGKKRAGFNKGIREKNFLRNVNINNNGKTKGLAQFERQLLPPPPYQALFRPPFAYSPNGKRQYINGREYWVLESNVGETTLIPVRQPSALLFQYTN